MEIWVSFLLYQFSQSLVLLLTYHLHYRLTGISPAAQTFLTGFALTDHGNPTQYATSQQVTGKVYGPAPYDQGSPADNAAGAILTAYNTGMAETTADYPEFNAGVLDSQVLYPGLYIWTTTVTLGASAIVTLVLFKLIFRIATSTFHTCSFVVFSFTRSIH